MTPENSLRIGLGGYEHSYDKDSSFTLGGILFSGKKKIDQNDKSDIVIYSLTDALLGAAASGGMAQLSDYPDILTIPATDILKQVEKDIHYTGFDIINIDITIRTSLKKINDKMAEMHAKLIMLLFLKTEQLNIKTTFWFQNNENNRIDRIGVTSVALLHERSRKKI